MQVLNKVTGEGLTVRKTERLVEELSHKTPAISGTGRAIPFKTYIRDIRILTNTIQENLDIVRRSGMETRFDMQQTDSGYTIYIQLEYAKKHATQLPLLKAAV
jgi:hypothetical protein